MSICITWYLFPKGADGIVWNSDKTMEKGLAVLEVN